MIAGWQRSVQSLRRFSEKSKFERCELCASTLAPRHQHLIDPRTREVVCSCDGCSILFDVEGATKYRRIPRVINHLENFILDIETWTKLSVPIGLVFFYRSSLAKSIVALYPSPAGLTEVLIEAETWQAVTKANPMLDDLREDVEALLVNRLRDSRDYFIAPMDRCFELAGLVRTRWKGFTGGDLVWSEINRYMTSLKEQAS